jgi:hypothetical protein
MRVSSFGAAAIVLAAVSVAGAQGQAVPSGSTAAAITCASPATLDVPTNPLRILGSQDSAPRTVFHPSDMLVLSAGTANGIQVGQQYFVRRPAFADARHRQVTGILTAATIRVVSANDTAALATVDRFCGAIYTGDYLELSPAPRLAPASEGPTASDLDFTSLSRVISANEYHITAGAGDLLTIDRGSEQGVTPGWRFAIYRDLNVSGLPLTSIGEGVVLSTGQGSSLAQITKSRDAVVPGDYVVPRK